MLFGHATGITVAESTMNSLATDGLKVKKLIALSNDGPNFNKTIWRAMQSALQNVGSEGMVDTGTCNIHVVHNSFSKGKKIFGSSVEELSTCLFSFFKYSAVRRKDFAAAVSANIASLIRGRTNRRAIAIRSSVCLYVCPFARLVVHCDHMMNFSVESNLWLDSPRGV